MYARIVRVSLTAETAQEAVTYFQDTVLPALKRHAGFAFGHCFYAPTNHHALMVSVWESVGEGVNGLACKQEDSKMEKGVVVDS